MKKIGIDCRFADTNSGIGRYTRELVAALLRREDPWSYRLLVRSKSERWLKNLMTGQDHDVMEAPFDHYSLSEQMRFPKLLRKSGIDLLFSPHFNIPLFCPVPFVITIHDLILHRYPNHAPFLKKMAYRVVMRHAVRSSRGIIAVSEFTSREIQKYYGDQLREKISVIGEGVGAAFRPRQRSDIEDFLRKKKITRPYFLYVGNAKQHKRIDLLLRAFIPLSADHSLVLVMSKSDADSLTFPPSTIVISDASDEDLAFLYSGAKVFVTASAYEGFGLPIAEARACGCPVIAYKEGAISEIAAPGSALIEGTSVEALTSAMRSPPPHYLPDHTFSGEQTAEDIAAIFKGVS